MPRTALSNTPSPKANSLDAGVSPDHGDAQSRIERLLLQNASFAAELMQQREETAALKRDRDARFAEIAVLTKMIEDKGGPPSAEIEQAEKKLADLTEYAAGLEHMLLQTMNSTSWRLTAPVRGLIRFLGRKPRPAPFQARYLDYGQ